MELYTLDNPASDRTWFYARDPADITDLVRNYRENMGEEERNHPQLKKCFKQDPQGLVKLMEPGTKGRIFFIAGMIKIGGEGMLGDVVIQVTDDFEVAMPHESLIYFDLWKGNIDANPRGRLYKVPVNHSMFGSQTFIPRDIVDAIQSVDMRTYIHRHLEDIEEVERKRDGHPSLKNVVRARDHLSNL